MLFYAFNPTLVQFKLTDGSSSVTSVPTFNPTLVQFKPAAGVMADLSDNFQSYLSPIQTEPDTLLPV